MKKLYSSKEQIDTKKLIAYIKAENKRLKQIGTKDDAIILLKAAGILNKSGNIAKPYRI